MHIQFKSAYPINFITCRLPHLPLSFSPVTFSLCVSPKLGQNGSVTVGITFVFTPKPRWRVPCRDSRSGEGAGSKAAPGEKLWFLREEKIHPRVAAAPEGAGLCLQGCTHTLLVTQQTNKQTNKQTQINSHLPRLQSQGGWLLLQGRIPACDMWLQPAQAKTET